MEKMLVTNVFYPFQINFVCLVTFILSSAYASILDKSKTAV